MEQVKHPAMKSVLGGDGEPPVEAGAVQDTAAAPSLTAAVRRRGTRHVAAVTLDEADEDELVPAAPVAVTE